MSFYQSPDQGPKDYTAGLTGFQFFSVLIGVAWVVAMVIAIIAALPTVIFLFQALFRATWPGFIEILATAALSAIGGGLVGLIRFRLKLRDGVVTELVATAISPGTINAARLGMAAVAFHVALGLASGFVAGALGATVRFDPIANTAVGLVIGGGTGGPSAGSGPLILLLALMLVIFVITLLFSLGLAAVCVAVAGGVTTGAAEGGARKIGELIVLILTRLWTTRLKPAARRIPPGPIAPNAALREFFRGYRATQSQHAWIAGYITWLSTRMPALSDGDISRNLDQYIAQSPRWREYQDFLAHYRNLPKFERYSDAWKAQHEDRRKLRLLSDAANEEKGTLVQFANAFAEAFPRMVEERLPAGRMETTDGAPVYDGTSNTLYHVHWRRSAILAGMRSGAYVGAVTALLACLFVFPAAHGQP